MANSSSVHNILTCQYLNHCGFIICIISTSVAILVTGVGTLQKISFIWLMHSNPINEFTRFSFSLATLEESS